MKTMLCAAVLTSVLGAVPVSASAGCSAPSERVNRRAALISVLEGNTACVPVARQPVMDAQEQHIRGGTLKDYKRGNDEVDGTATIGTWSVGGTDGRGVFVRYDYTGGESYIYAVWRIPGTTNQYSFCSATNEVQVRMSDGLGPC